MICFGVGIARRVVYLSIFKQDRSRWLHSCPLAAQPRVIQFGLFLALYLSIAICVGIASDGPLLLYGKNMVMDNENSIQTWNDEFTSPSIAGQVYPADMEKHELHRYYCLRRWHSGTPIFQKAGSHSFAGPWSAGNVLLGRYVITVIVGEKSGSDTSDKDSWLSWSPSFCLMIACVISLNILYFARKIILAVYGYKIGYFDWGYDRKKLQEIARREASETQRWLFNLLNTLFYVLAICMFIFFILTTVLGLLKAAFGR